jgi:hypothetical protein
MSHRPSASDPKHGSRDTSLNKMTMDRQHRSSIL